MIEITVITATLISTVISSYRNLGLYPEGTNGSRQEAGGKSNREIPCAGLKNLLSGIPIIRISLTHWRMASCVGSSFKAAPYTVA